MSTRKKKLFTIVSKLRVGKGKSSITKKKNYQKSRPKIMSADVDQLQRKWSLLRPHVIWMDI